MYNDNNNHNSWRASTIPVFWSTIAPLDHVVQIYENDKIFMHSLQGYVSSGLLAGESVVIIATQEHINNLNLLLSIGGFNIPSLIATNHYIILDADETLEKFMVNGKPDENLFNTFMSAVIKRAQSNNGKVRAFGEMVAILWKKGFKEATVELEKLWNKLHYKNNFSLFCAYPKDGFESNGTTSVKTVCNAHHKVIVGGLEPGKEIFYMNTA